MGRRFQKQAGKAGLFARDEKSTGKVGLFASDEKSTGKTGFASDEKSTGKTGFASDEKNKGKTRLPVRDEKSTRERAVTYLAGFLFLMLICTMVSRGIYAYQMPRVALGQASSKSLFHTIRAQGRVEAAKEIAAIVPQGIRIREICVKTGQKITPDTVLLCLDGPDLKSQLQDLDEKIRVAQETIAAFWQGNAANQGSAKNQGSVLGQTYALAHLQAQRDTYRELLKEKGQVKSGLDAYGYVTEICVKPGERTPDSAVMLLADCSDGVNRWDFRAQLTKEQADMIKPGDTVNLQFQDGKGKEEGCLVSAVRKTVEGEYEALVPAAGSGLSPGDSGTMEFTIQSGRYGCCVPLQALFSDVGGEYLLLIRETDTILGTALHAVRRDVAVLDKNESTAALAEQSLGADGQFVVHASKEVASGDEVRLFEEEEWR